MTTAEAVEMPAGKLSDAELLVLVSSTFCICRGGMSSSSEAAARHVFEDVEATARAPAAIRSERLVATIIPVLGRFLPLPSQLPPLPPFVSLVMVVGVK